MSAGYPFTAIVGMDDLRLALVLSAVSPATGGVLVRGEKGTAKSTMVRALANLLPPVEVVAGCRFSCAPKDPDPECPDGPHGDAEDTLHRPARLVELPVGASEDRVLGSIHLERALTEGVTTYEPGLLAGANRGVLYVDEVNLLHDHLVDVLLDAAAMGRAKVERENVSVSHAARFVMVGTMNPEEGELRPQLLDRFGLTVEVAATREPALRADVVRARLAYEADPDGFAAGYADDERRLSQRIVAAQQRLPDVVLTDAALRQITEVCSAFEVDGLRADLVTAQTAIAHAAWSGRTVVETEDVRAAARLALPHRRRRNPFDAPGIDDEQLDQALRDAEPDDPGPDEPDPDDPGPNDPGPNGAGPDGSGPDDPRGPGDGDADGREPDSRSQSHPEHQASATRPDSPGDVPPQSEVTAEAEPRRSGIPGNAPAGGDVQPAEKPFRARLLTVPGHGSGAEGRRSRAITPNGRTIGSKRPAQNEAGSIHLFATLRAAAAQQPARKAASPAGEESPQRRSGTLMQLRRDDLRLAVGECQWDAVPENSHPADAERRPGAEARGELGRLGRELGVAYQSDVLDRVRQPVVGAVVGERLDSHLEVVPGTLAEVQRCANEGMHLSSFALVEDYFYLGLVNFVEQMAQVSGGGAAYCNAHDLGNMVIDSFVGGRRRRRAV
jgi:magnesium chelatase subunit D